MAFNRSPLVVGRDETCDLTLAGNEVSRRHAEFTVDGPVVAVRDIESRNGVFVNGARRSAAPLVRGDVVRCGEWIGVAVSEAPGAPGFHEIAPGCHYARNMANRSRRALTADDWMCGAT